MLCLLLGWRLFDDSWVRDVNENKIVTRDAYVLFYRRRDSSKTFQHSINNTLSSHLNHNLNMNKKQTASSNVDEEFYSCDEEEFKNEQVINEREEDDDDDEEMEESNNSTSDSDSYTNLDEVD